MPGSNGSDRLDRIEAALDMLIADHVKSAEEHKQLLRAQVVLTDTVQKLAEAQRHTDDRLNALISVVDDLVRRPRSNP